MSDRIWEIDVPVDTRMFGATQILPRKLLGFTMTGWAGWLREHAVSFPKLIREHGTGVVIIGHHLRFPKRLGFFDADGFTLRAGPLIARAAGRYLCQHYELIHEGEVFAYSDAMGRVVRLDPRAGLAAKPGRLPDAVLDRFLPSERLDKPPPRRMPELPQDAEPVGSGTHRLRIEQRDCEVAEQWSYVEAVSHAAAARATVALASGGNPRLKLGLRRPLTAIDIAYARPMYIFDQADVKTEVMASNDELIWSHEIVSAIGAGGVHARVIERHRC